VLNNLVDGNSLFWLNLQKLWNKVSCNTWKSFWPFDLKSQNIAKQLVLTAALEWWTSSKKFKQENTKVPDIKRLIVAWLFNHLWCKIFRSSTICQSAIIIVEIVTPTKVCKLYNAIWVKQNVFWLYISMDNWRVQRMQVLHSWNAFTQILCCNLFIKAAFFLEQTIYLSFSAKL